MDRNKFICVMLIVLLLLTGCSPYKAKVVVNSSNSTTEKSTAILQLESSHFKFYSKEQDKSCLSDLSNTLEGNYARITSDLHAALDEKVDVYIYSDLSSFHEAINQPDAPNLVVGKASSLNVIKMVNPSKADRLTYSDFMKIIVHEFTHIVVYSINPDMGSLPMWLNEGIATFEAKQEDGVSQVISNAKVTNKVPALKDLEPNSYDFANIGGYAFSYSLVDYIVKTYGYDKLIALIKSPTDFEKILSISKDDFQKKWIAQLK